MLESVPSRISWSEAFSSRPLFSPNPLSIRRTAFTSPRSIIRASLRSSDDLCRWTGRIFIAGLCTLPLARAATDLLRRPQPHGARPVLTHLARSWRAGDVVYISHKTRPTFDFYRRFGGIEGLVPLSEMSHNRADQRPCSRTRPQRAV